MKQDNKRPLAAIRNILLLSLACALLGGPMAWALGGGEQGKAPDIRWTWRKKFTNITLEHLAAAWNGKSIAIALNDHAAPKKEKGTVVALMDETGRLLHDWRIPGRAKGIALDGVGKKLLAETEEKKTLLYTREGDKMALAASAPLAGALLSPQGEYLAAAGTGGIAVYSPELKKHRTVEAGAGALFLFPFMNKPESLLVWDAGKGLSLNAADKQEWSLPLKGMPGGIASAALTGNLVAAWSKEGTITFIGGQGNVLGVAEFGGEPQSVHCANNGALCVAAGGGDGGFPLKGYGREGRLVWEAKGAKGERLIAAYSVKEGQGAVVGIRSDAGDRIAGIGPDGKEVWRHRVEGRLDSLTASWNGGLVAFVTDKKTLSFINVEAMLNKKR